MKDFLRVCGVEGVKLDNFKFHTSYTDVNLKKCRNIINSLLIYYKSQFDISYTSNNGKDCLFYNRAKSALKNFKDLLYIPNNVNKKIFDDVGYCIAYIISKDPNIDIFSKQILCSDYIERFKHLILLKNNDHYWKKIMTQVSVYRKIDSSFFNYHSLNNKNHFSEKYILFFGSIMISSVIATTGSALFFYSNVTFNSVSIAVNFILFSFSLYFAFIKPQFLSIKEEMSLFSDIANPMDELEGHLSRSEVTV